MTERIVETLLGLFLIYLGYRVGWKGEMGTIHRYHTAYVAEQDRMKFCRGCGIGEIVTGAGCALMPWINLLTRSAAGYWIGVLAIGAGFLGIVGTILRYNGRLF